MEEGRKGGRYRSGPWGWERVNLEHLEFPLLQVQGPFGACLGTGSRATWMVGNH